MRKFTLLLIFMLVLLCFSGTAFATESVGAYVYIDDTIETVSSYTYLSKLMFDWTDWPEKTNVPIDKVWTIKFNQPININSIFNNSIYITDPNGNKYYSTVKALSGTEVTISTKYSTDKQCYLYINGVKSEDGKKTVTPIRMKFSTVGDTTPPSAPTGLRMTYYLLSPALTWDRNTESDIAGYYTYASTDGKNYYRVKISGQDLNIYNYFVMYNLVSGTKLYFCITAVDKKGNESEKSQPFLVSVP